jgi:hypothetical protein
MVKRDDPPIVTVAPTARGDGSFETLDPDLSLPVFQSPPAPAGIPSLPPLFRPLKVYAFGPSRGRARGNIQTLAVPYEKLAPGPVGERIAVVDYDVTRKCFYDPIDLDDPHIGINGGLDPSESDPHFHQQMAYAVVSESLRRIELALGRAVRERSPGGTKPLKIFVHPHYSEMQNAYTSKEHMLCGYFRAGAEARGRVLPGQTVFTCLSQDVVGHLVTHVVLNATRPDLGPSLDNWTLQEALSDLTPLLFHFTNREIVFDTVQRTAGVIYRSQLAGSASRAGQARIVAELESDNPLLALSGEFGDAIGRAGGIRNALLAPDPAAFDAATEHHARGAIVVAAVFDAMFSIYEERTADLFRIHRAGGGRIDGTDLPEPLAGRLCDEIAAIATRIFGTCWRGVDYCPPIHTTMSDFLRACITADYEYEKEDPWGVRDALMQAFRVRGITPKAASFFSEEALRWPVVTEDWPTLNPQRSSDDALAELQDFVAAGKVRLGMSGRARPTVYPLQTARFASPNDLLQFSLSTQILTTPRTGVTVIFDAGGKVRHVIPTSKDASASATAGQ